MPSRSGPGPGLVLISASDTDLLAAQASPGVSWRLANPARTSAADLPALLDGAFCVVVRLLGGRRSWPEGLEAVLASGLPAVVLSGEPAPDAELMALSTVPAGVATEALAYLREGGPRNLAELARFLSDTILLTGEGFEPPEVLPDYGRQRPSRRAAAPARPPRRGDRVLPLARGRREHRVRRHAGRRGRGRRGQRGAGVLRLAARRAPGVLRPAGGGGRGHRDRARGGRDGGGGRVRGRGRRRLGRGRAGRAGRPGAAGPVPDHAPGSVGGVQRGAHPDGRGHAGGGARVRRPPDHGAVLVQGGRPGRGAGLHRRPGTGRPGGGHRGGARPAPARPGRGPAAGHHAVLLPDQARPDRQRGRAGHPRLGRGPAPGAARGRLRPGRRGSPTTATR